MELHTAALLIASVAVACSAQSVPDELLDIWRHPELALASHTAPRLHRFAAQQLPGAYNQSCQSRVLSCRDCNNVNQCAYVGGSYEYMQSSTCSEEAPFCNKNTGKCVAQLPSHKECSFPARHDQVNSYWRVFQCFKGEAFQGYYPSPYFCDRYFVCADGVAYIYNCPSGYVYNHSRAACVPQGSTTCTTFQSKCSLHRNEYVLHDDDLSLYAYCDTYRNPRVSKCRPNYKIDPTNPEQPCQPYCGEAGRIPNYDDPRGYYECYEARGNVPSPLSEPLEQWCPQGQVFSLSARRCVPTSAA